MIYKLNLKFSSQKECEEWEAKNLYENGYKGECVMMATHDSEIGSDEVILKEVWTV